MTFKLASLGILLCLGATACSHDKNADLAPGTYKSSTSSTDANGTAVDKDTTKTVTVDQNGDKNVNTSTKTSVDPKGLFNKSTSTSSTNSTYGQ